MTTDRRRVLRLFHEALGLDAEDREVFLRQASGGDEDVYRQVQSLLAREPPAAFLDQAAPPAADLIGHHVGVYRVESHLGSGGMGQVFRAHDTRLRRDVALKVLPRAFGADPERRSRFEREARLLATLNHPHIGAIYGVEDANGELALVLELVDGETLADHLKRTHRSTGRGLPVAEALRVAQQMAEALEAAHERSIVHRDLKPTNVMVTADGFVKVLDFGLAKAMSVGDPEPRLTDTRTGVLMGTPAYMSPEQARGAKVDRRTDIWAFGCVLFEMLAGRPIFSGDSIPETLAAVLHTQPDWAALPSDTPPAVRLVLESCLQKDPTARLRDVGDVRLALTGVFTAPARPLEASAAPLAIASSRRSWWRRAGPAAATFGVGALASAAAFVLRDVPNPPAPVTRLSLGTRGAAALHVDGNNQELAITPDGSRVVYVGDGGRRIFVRALDQLEPLAIATGVLFRNLFVSPDGQWVGYGQENGPLKKVPIAGGPPIDIATTGGLRGAVWLADNTIVFGTARRDTGLLRVSADGGTPQVFTKPDAARNEYDHYWPEALPDGRAVLYTVLARTGGLGAARIAVHDLETNTSTDLLTGATNAVYLRSGHLAYVAGGTLWAVPFDAGRRTITGTAVPGLKLSATTGVGAGNFAVSATGTLAYAHAPNYDPFARTLSWIDRGGKLEPLDAPQHPYMQPRISHDGTRIVHGTGRIPENNLWVLDVGRRALTRLRNEASRDQMPTWSLDDHWILYASDRAGGEELLQIWRQAADGTGEPELLVDRGFSAAVTPDGTHLVFSASSPPGLNDIMRMALDGSRRVSPLVQTRFNEQGDEVSPDGRWLAYQSNVSGRLEVYVGPYPNAASARWPVSTGGGRFPLWSRDGRELFYVAPDGALMGVHVTSTGSRWAATSPVKVLEPGYWSNEALIGRQYDISPDGKRFLVVTPPKDNMDPPDLVVVQHWLEELKARLNSK